jgi:hypothetical protein
VGWFGFRRYVPERDSRGRQRVERDICDVYDFTGFRETWPIFLVLNDMFSARNYFSGGGTIVELVRRILDEKFPKQNQKPKIKSI